MCVTIPRNFRAGPCKTCIPNPAMWEPWSSKISPVILEGLLAPAIPSGPTSAARRGSSLNDGMVNPTGAHFDTIGNADPARDVGNFLAYLKYTGAELRWTEK